MKPVETGLYLEDSLMRSSLSTTNDVYRLIDAGDFQKLEQIGPYVIVRPSPQAPWPKRLPKSVWSKADAVFTRTSAQEGRWSIHNRKLPETWSINTGEFRMQIERTNFGHLGIFPEQHENWHRLHMAISAWKGRSATSDQGAPIKVLNLFAYTGGASLACAAAGAEVTHVDASKTSVHWARENARLSGLETAPVRWIVDDVQKFVQRELRRGQTYQGIILDPPSFGRGPKGQLWKIEEHLNPLLADLAQLFDEKRGAFVLLSGHTPGYTPITLKNLLTSHLSRPHDAQCLLQEMVTPADSQDEGGNQQGCKAKTHLPSGSMCLLARPTVAPLLGIAAEAEPKTGAFT